MLLLALALSLGRPAPLDMPRAESFLVKEGDAYRLEDRYNRLDLWTSRAVDGRWIDGDGCVFMVCSLAVSPPAIEENASSTRIAYSKSCVEICNNDVKKLREAIEALSSVEIAEDPMPPRHKIRGYKSVRYWQGTNTQVIVCSYLKEKCATWRLVIWELASSDDFDERISWLEDKFLGEGAGDEVASMPIDRIGMLSEREQLLNDARHSIMNYSGWTATGDREFVVLDNLSGRREFIVSMTNTLSIMRKRYAKVFPTEISQSNVLCIARIYGGRQDYLAASDESMSWTAAYWSPIRRELVAYLPLDGEDALMRTIRHEAFHQYLSYAGAMLQAAPWINEGYAEYFEDADDRKWLLGTTEEIDEYSTMLPSLLKMNYDEFYSGTDRQRHINYMLAKSIAEFIEHGADKVRFQPFKNIKQDYMSALIRTQDMREATDSAFKSVDMVTLFVDEWRRFWKNR